MAPQVTTAAAASLLCHRQSGRTACRPQAKPTPTTKQLYAALVCCLMVSTAIIHVISWITTHLPTPKGWKSEVAWLVDP